MKKRNELLEEIFNLEKPDSLQNLSEDLREIGWDSPEGEVANLTTLHIISILNRYLNGNLTEQQIENWANLVEMREDITFGATEDEERVIDAIHELANPALEGALTHASAKQIILRLQE